MHYLCNPKASSDVTFFAKPLRSGVLMFNCSTLLSCSPFLPSLLGQLVADVHVGLPRHCLQRDLLTSLSLLSSIVNHHLFLIFLFC